MVPFKRANVSSYRTQ